MIEFRRLDVMEQFTQFDPEWYLQNFDDVRLLQMDPRHHYAAFGYFLGRGVSAQAVDPIAIPRLAEALGRAPRISYCVPVMNRPEDVRCTLKTNLDANRDHAEKIEFVIIFMDEDREIHDWVRHHFSDDLRSGYLRMIIEPPLDGWHFGKAKNRHKQYIVGEIYSSLDADNFVTAAETAQLLHVFDAHPNGFIFHHFTGTWGDGSSGRISMPAWLYSEIGYDETFMPRQFDEMDVLLTAMVRYPQLPLVRVRSDNHGFSSKRSVEFFTAAGVSNPVIIVDKVEHFQPLNPKSKEYVSDNKSMNAMTTFNQGVCFMKNAPDQKLREKYINLAVQGRWNLADTIPKEKILSTLFYSSENPLPGGLKIDEDDVCIFACMKNDINFLQPFYDHYKSLGVKYFFIVDDGSDVPLAQSMPYTDVFIFSPKVGTFLTAKGLWLEGIAKAYLEEGYWMLTLDADEFIDLPQGYDTLPELARALRARDQEIVPALLVDMVPAPNVRNEDLDEVESRFLEVFDHHVWAEDTMTEDYESFRSIKWGFGPYAALSWRLDTRYHAFKTFDSLRKMPLIQFRAGRHINQGFHTLHYNDGTPNPGTEIWDTDMVLIIRHFKLLKLFSKAAREQTASAVRQTNQSAYHARTTENIAKIFGSGSAEQIKQVLSLPSRRSAEKLLMTLQPSSYHVGKSE